MKSPYESVGVLGAFASARLFGFERWRAVLDRASQFPPASLLYRHFLPEIDDSSDTALVFGSRARAVVGLARLALVIQVRQWRSHLYIE